MPRASSPPSERPPGSTAGRSARTSATSAARAWRARGAQRPRARTIRESMVCGPTLSTLELPHGQLVGAADRRVRLRARRGGPRERRARSVRVGAMGERTSYTPGTFCWVELSTSDVGQAKTFYAELLGWEYEDLPVGAGVDYTMARLGGRDVAALQPLRQAGMPPNWLNYVAADDADAVANRA